MPDPYRVRITYPDGCSIQFTGPHGDELPRADWFPVADGHEHPDLDYFDASLRDAVARAFFDALTVSDDDPSADTAY